MLPAVSFFKKPLSKIKAVTFKKVLSFSSSITNLSKPPVSVNESRVLEKCHP